MKNLNTSHVVLFSALAWAASLFVVPFGLHIIFYSINLASNYRFDPFTNGFIPALLFGLTTAGALAGYCIARLLKLYASLPSIRVLPIVLAWAVALFLSVYLMFWLSSLFIPPASSPLPPGEPEPLTPGLPIFIRVLARDFILSLIPGILGGLVLAWEILRGVGINGWRMTQITIGWGIGFALGGMLGNAMLNLHNILSPIGMDPGWVVQDLFIWLHYAVTGLIAGAIGAWVTMRAIRSAARPHADATPVIQVPDL